MKEIFDFLLSKNIINVEQYINIRKNKYLYITAILSNDNLVSYVESFGHTYKCTLGKFLYKFYRSDFTPGEITHICEKFKAVLETPQTFKILESNELKESYYRTHYVPNHGSLSNSCMRFKKCQDKDFFKIYGDNAKMLVMVPNRGKRLLGRAILWQIADTIFMDRVYATEPYIENQFYNYAKENGWYCLSKNKYTFGSINAIQEWLNPKTNYTTVIMPEVIIKLKEKCEHFPFMDSFCYLSEDLNFISTAPFPNGYVLQTTSGSYYKPKEL